MASLGGEVRHVMSLRHWTSETRPHYRHPMDALDEVDVSFDFRTDRKPGVDPDALRGSPTLRRYHKVLWSKTLPNGHRFELDTNTPGEYLHHASDLGEFFLSSDALIHTYDYGYGERVKPFTDAYTPEQRDEFERATYTMGGMLVFPSNRLGGRQTINQRRGTHGQIKDRCDLTLECIRRYYTGESSPLASTLEDYAPFFLLFGDFRGYVEFFLLQSLVTADYAGVRFALPFDGFERSPLPLTAGEYAAYRSESLAFISARNQRIASVLGEAT